MAAEHGLLSIHCRLVLTHEQEEALKITQSLHCRPEHEGFSEDKDHSYLATETLISLIDSCQIVH